MSDETQSKTAREGDQPKSDRGKINDIDKPTKDLKNVQVDKNQKDIPILNTKETKNLQETTNNLRDTEIKKLQTTIENMRDTEIKKLQTTIENLRDTEIKNLQDAIKDLKKPVVPPTSDLGNIEAQLRSLYNQYFKTMPVETGHDLAVGIIQRWQVILGLVEDVKKNEKNKKIQQMIQDLSQEIQTNLSEIGARKDVIEKDPTLVNDKELREITCSRATRALDWITYIEEETKEGGNRP